MIVRVDTRQLLLIPIKGNTLYPLKVSGKPVSEEEHTVTLFYAVPVSIEGTATQCLTEYYGKGACPKSL